MAHKKKPTLSKIFLSLLIGIPSLFNLFTRTIQLIGFEARLAGKNVAKIIVLFIVIAILLGFTWACLLALLLVYFLSLAWTITFSLSMILLLHVILILISFAFIHSLKNRLEMKEIKRRLKHPERAYADYED